MKYFWTADAHLGHYNIIRYTGRPFKDVDEMNDTIIENWNNRVSDEDTVFHVGDFCFKNSPGGKAGEGLVYKAKIYEEQLNGHIVFIKGNHDKNNSVKTIIEKMVVRYGPHYVHMVHHPDHYDSNYALNFVGHVHEKWKFKRIYIPSDNRFTDLINVGVDVWDFKPHTFEEIYNSYRRWVNQQSKKGE